jgi:hypothetical protein
VTPSSWIYYPEPAKNIFVGLADSIEMARAILGELEFQYRPRSTQSPGYGDNKLPVLRTRRRLEPPLNATAYAESASQIRRERRKA